jgi:hypothetical protein
MEEKARSLMQFLGNFFFFFAKLENSKPPSPLSQAILTFWPRGGSSANRHPWKQREYNRGRTPGRYSSALGSQPPCNSLQAVNQVTHQSQFKKTKENLLVMMRSCMKKLCFFLQTGISLPSLVVVLVVGFFCLLVVEFR